MDVIVVTKSIRRIRCLLLSGAPAVVSRKMDYDFAWYLPALSSRPKLESAVKTRFEINPALVEG